MLCFSDGHHPSVASAYGTDAEIRQAILRRVNPLPGNLREYLARHMNPSIGPPEFVLQTLDSCNVDPNGNVKTEAAITYYTGLKSSGNVPEAVINKLRAEIVHERDLEYWLNSGVRWIDHPRSFGRESRVGDFGEGIPLLSPDVYQLQANPAFIRMLLEHWEEIGPLRDRIALGVKGCATSGKSHALKRMSSRPQGPRRSSRSRKIGGPTFGERVAFSLGTVPGGRLLLDKCLKALQIGEDKSIDLGWETLAAAEILGNQFAHDEGVYNRIIAECNGVWVPYHAMLALCEGWPESDVLERYRGRLSLERVRNQFTSIVAIRFLCLKESAEGVWTTVNRVISNRRPQNYSETTYAPLVRRVRADDRLCETASEELRNSTLADPESVISTYPDLSEGNVARLENVVPR